MSCANCPSYNDIDLRNVVENNFYPSRRNTVEGDGKLFAVYFEFGEVTGKTHLFSVEVEVEVEEWIDDYKNLICLGWVNIFDNKRKLIMVVKFPDEKLSKRRSDHVHQ